MDKVLFIDDEINILNSIRRILRKEAYQTFIANSGAQALEMLKENPDIAIVVSDFRMPSMSGSELLEQVSTLYPHTIRMILSGYADKENIIDTINKGHIYKFLVKPWDDNVLKGEISQALSIYHEQNAPKGLAVLINQAPNGIIVTDIQHNLIQFNPYIEHRVGSQCHDYLNQSLFKDNDQTTILGPSNIQTLIDDKLNQNDAWSGEGYLVDKLYTHIPVSIHVKKYQENLTSQTVYLYQIIDLTKQKAIEDEIHYRYHHDKATGLPNRSALIDYYAHRSKSESFKNAAYLAIDCCRFDTIIKVVSDDDTVNLIKHIAQSVRQVIQVTSETVLYYLGQGNFGLLINDMQTNDLETIAKNLCHVFKTPHDNMDSKIPINVNVAICKLPDDGSTIENVLSNCETTLQYLRKRGINAYAFYDQGQKATLVQTSKDDLSFESELYDALSHEQFIIFYQAFMDFKTNKIFGCEALLRWNHPRLGIVPPDRFIPLLEKTGLIFQVTRWIMDQVFHQIAAWQKAGFQSIKVSINLPSNQFRQAGFYNELSDLLEKTNISPASVELEITESMLMENIAENKEMLEKLRKLGFHLALDDFGTGYSSFSILKMLPFNILKIDRSFVQDVAQFQNAASILSSMIAMGQSLGMHIIAEGVETDAQIEILKNFNCNYGQGYFFSKPVPANQFFELLTSSHQQN